MSNQTTAEPPTKSYRDGLEVALGIVRRFGATYRALDSTHGAEPFSVFHTHFEPQAAACMEIGGEINKEIARCDQ